MSQPCVQKIGKYEILGEIGQGGMGVVYKARDPFIGRLVALKTVTPELVSNPEVLRRFYREAQSAGALQHPNIVTVFDLGEVDGYPYIAMEYVDGESLQNMIIRRSHLPLAAKLRLVEQVCMGLDHAHKSGIVHRDVKPGNILVKNDGTVKVVDFGIVHVESTTLTKTGTFMGTIQYASPEQLQEGKVDARSDLWSVAVVIYELVSYTKPFEGSNFGAIVGKILTAEPEPLSRLCPGIPVELDEIINKGLRKNAADRFQSLEELLACLEPLSQRLQKTLIDDLVREARDLKEQGDLNAAREKLRAVLILDRTQTEAKQLNTTLAAELQRLSALPKVRELVSAGEVSFQRGEYTDAARALAEALGLNPNDTLALSLKDRVQREQDRLQRVREALTAGQKALKQGDLTGAEVELRKVLELEEGQSQAARLLSVIREDRLSREKHFRLKEVMWNADNLIADGKYMEAQAELSAAQGEFRDSEEIAQKLELVKQRQAERNPAGGTPAPGSDKIQWRDAQLTQIAASLAADDIVGATRLLGGVKGLFPSDSKVEAIEKQLDLKKAQTAVQPASPLPVATPAPSVAPVSVTLGKPHRPWGALFGGAALVIALALGGLYFYEHTHPAGGATASAEELQTEHDAQLLQVNGNLSAALAKWRALAAHPGVLQNEAKLAIQQITAQQNLANQEQTLYSQARTAQQSKQWDDAIGLYQKVADLNGPMREQAVQAVESVKALKAGRNLAALEKEKYDRATAALAQHDYAKAHVFFEQVVDLNVPDSVLAAKAQVQMASLDAILQTQQEFAAADKAQTAGDLSQALNAFQDVAGKPGPFQAEAQSRAQQISQILAARQQKEQTEKSLQADLKKFQDLQAQKKYHDAAALLPAIGQQGGDANQLKGQLESAEQAEFESLSNQFNQAKNNKDSAALRQLTGPLQALAAGSGQPASEARDYVENRIPAALSQVNQANQKAPAPPQPPPAPHAPVVTLIASGGYRPWTRSVQKGMLVPEYNVEGGVKPLDLAMPPVRGAPSASFVTIKINIDESGNASPDIILQDPSGLGPAVIEAAKKWKFKPPTVRGKSVRTSTTVKVAF